MLRNLFCRFRVIYQNHIKLLEVKKLSALIISEFWHMEAVYVTVFGLLQACLIYWKLEVK